MSSTDPGQIELLRQARERAARLVGEVRRQRDELLEAPRPPNVDEESIVAGRVAMDDAVASAERVLAAVEAALREVSPESE
jgi:hypothetical protein